MAEKNCPECREGKLTILIREVKFNPTEYYENVAQNGMFLASANEINQRRSKYYQCNKCGYAEEIK